MNRMIRPRGFIILGVGFIFIVLYLKLFFDVQIKSWLERSLTELNGAQVNIGAIDSNFFKGTLELKDVQFGNPTTPMRNTFEISAIKFEIAVAPLLRKKLHILNVDIDGFQYWTQRLAPADSPDLFSVDHSEAALMDRVSKGIYTGIKNELTDNPLRHIAQLSSEGTLQSRIGLIQDKISSVQHLKKISNGLKEKEPFWERKKAELLSAAALAGLEERARDKRATSDSTVIEELSQKTEETQTLLKELKGQIEASEQALKATENLLTEDVLFIRRELGLPSDNQNDLTDLIFGPAWLGYLEKLSYWLEFSRTQSPVGSLTGSFGITVLERKGQRAVHFGKLGTLPTFLLQKATLRSGFRKNSTKVVMNGTLEGLNSDPVLFGRPTTLHLTADYPEKGFRQFELNAEMDHTKEVPQETLNLKIGSFHLINWPLTRTPDLQLEIEKALVALELNGQFTGNEMNMDWKLKVSETEYGIKSRFRQVQSNLEQILTGLYSFDLEGSVEGPLDSLTFQATSGLGKQLAEGLKIQFKHEFAVLNDAILSETKALLPPIEEDISDTVRKYREELQPTFEKTLEKLKEIQKKTVHRLS